MVLPKTFGRKMMKSFFFLSQNGYLTHVVSCSNVWYESSSPKVISPMYRSPKFHHFFSIKHPSGKRLSTKCTSAIAFIISTVLLSKVKICDLDGSGRPAGPHNSIDRSTPSTGRSQAISADRPVYRFHHRNSYSPYDIISYITREKSA